MLNNNFRIALYDLSLPLEERLEKAVVYESIKFAAARLGLTENKIRTSINSKRKLYIERLDKTFAVRHIQ